MTKKVNVIGAGIAGLSVASYLQRNGYDTEIFEMHSLPGGLCTSWKRKGYTFDGCIHWLVGSSPSHPYYHLWNEILDMRSLNFIEKEYFIKIFIDKVNHLTIYSDADALGNEFKGSLRTMKKSLMNLFVFLRQSPDWELANRQIRKTSP
jgi:phytoene dehydrogenase-like protein